MKGILIILVLLAVLFGGYLVYRNLSEQISVEDDTTSIRAIEKAREAADTIEKIQKEVQRRARQSSE